MSSSSSSAIVYYITAHGYGHGTRSCDILRALREADGARPLIVVSDLPRLFLDARLAGCNCAVRPGCFDVGMVQLDSLRADIDRTLVECRVLLARADALCEQETAFLRGIGAAAVVCDIPSIPLEAAKRAGVPALAAGNFGWDWIYEEFIERDAGWREIVEVFRRGYRQADLLLQMPFSGPMTAFPRRTEIGVTARPGRPRRSELAALTGADPAKRWVLLSFAKLEWGGEALAELSAHKDWEFFSVLPACWPGFVVHAIDRRDVPYSDVLASCDIVVTKPGFGVLAECAVNRKPIVYAEREHFREYAVLEAALKRHFRSVHVPAAELYRGRLRHALEQIEHQPEPAEPVPMGGDVMAARLILEHARS